jgi:non-specific serine/threonine protein kinase
LSFANDAGFVHGDVQPYLVFMTSSGQVRLAGLEVAFAPLAEDAEPKVVDAHREQHVQASMRADLLALGVMLYRIAAGRVPAEEADVGVTAARLLSGAGEPLRLPASLPHPVPDPLRAILSRAVDVDESVGYRSVRALSTALEGWLKADTNNGESTFKALIDKVRSDGLLPASEETRERMSSLRQLEGESTRQMSELLLGDLAVALELLRAVNTAQQRSGRADGAAGILTLHRAVALLGLEGIRRCALALKPWPGSLRGAAVDRLAEVLERCRQAARVARLLRPQGYDAEAVYMVAVMQNLGRIVLQYHSPEQAMQIRALMFPEDRSRRAGTEAPAGLSEETAAFSVLGVDLAAVGMAVGRYLGLDTATLMALKRLPAKGPVLPAARTDEEALCQTASCANEAIDALQLPSERAAVELNAIVARYSRTLRLTVRGLKDALVANGLTSEIARTWLKNVPGLAQDLEDDW